MSHYNPPPPPRPKHEASDDVYSLASRTIAGQAKEIRDWRIRAQDAEIELKQAREELEATRLRAKHLTKISEVFNDIYEMNRLTMQQYANMVRELQAEIAEIKLATPFENQEWIDGARKEMNTLHAKLDQALGYIPRGDNDEGFTFDNGDCEPCGQHASHSEAMVDFWCQALPITMSCLNRLGAYFSARRESGAYSLEVIQACKHAIDKIHERSQVGDHICSVSGQIRESRHWLNEKEEIDG